ncbi:hypothetical protein ABZ468_42915 [Streptomyces sp. NPDC005708]|uniref:hypothetical protein n=1 Tax=Streptomyces sp. NPDC005708 TaxID=3154564 RepID=UPI0034098D03
MALERARQLVGEISTVPVEDPWEALAETAGELRSLKAVLRARVEELEQIRWRGESEQIRGELQAYMAILRDNANVQAQMAKIMLDERAVRIKEQQALMIRTAVERALREAGLEGEALERGRQAVGRHLKVIRGTVERTEAVAIERPGGA